MVVGEKSASGSTGNNFYGVFDKVLSFQYPMERRVFLFKCRWFDMDKKKNHRTQLELGYKSIHMFSFSFFEELVILVIQAHLLHQRPKKWCQLKGSAG